MFTRARSLAQIILRRVVSRSAVKGVFPLIGLPIVAFWNAVLARQVMHAVRTVALGRMCITTVTDTLLGMHQELSRQVAAGVELQKAVELSRAKSFAVASPENSFDALAMPDSLKAAILRSISVAVVSSREFHPNLELLMKHLIFRLRINPETIPELDNIDLYYKSCLPSLSRVDSYTVLTFLAFALLLDGDLTVTNKIFIKRAQTCCGLTPNLAGLNRIADKFENPSPAKTPTVMFKPPIIVNLPNLFEFIAVDVLNRFFSKSIMDEFATIKVFVFFLLENAP